MPGYCSKMVKGQLLKPKELLIMISFIAVSLRCMNKIDTEHMVCTKTTLLSSQKIPKSSFYINNNCYKFRKLFNFIDIRRRKLKNNYESTMLGINPTLFISM